MTSDFVSTTEQKSSDYTSLLIWHQNEVH